MSPQVAAVSCLGFSASLRKRYVQWVDATRYAVVRLPASVAALGEKADKSSGSVAVSFDAGNWEQVATAYDFTHRTRAQPFVTPPMSGEAWVDWYGHSPATNLGAANVAFAVLLAKAQVTIQSSHRRNYVRAEVGFDARLDLDKTVSIATPALSATGKVRSVRDAWDMDRGALVTGFSLALTEVYGTGVPAELTIPMETAPPVIPAGPFTASPLTHTGGTATATAIQTVWHGYFCNVTQGATYSATGQVYPVQFTLRTPAIEAPSRNNLITVTASIIDVAVTADSFTITG